MITPEIAIGARWFPDGSAPEGFNVGLHGSAGQGSYHYENKPLFFGETTQEDGSGFTWSAGASAGYEWISKGGFCFGLRLEVTHGTISLRDHENDVLVGLGYSIGGVL
ncbi:hypothetical protein AKJ08_3222 [Vulgatibacter incomptus]|uniref:Uncharacterized protein n=1 Tax=Vulgatibacter incomptus TaxID=1391653 RepID=A0A0K1PH37_9BACT|nr:hypothetical protein AKJ08_3222 [Vulgatibacter incomptus]